MDTRTILWLVFLSAMLANLIDYGVSGGGAFLPFPRSGRSKYFFLILSLALLISAALSVIDTFPSLTFDVAGLLFGLSYIGYSIVIRHPRKKGKI